MSFKHSSISGSNHSSIVALHVDGVSAAADYSHLNSSPPSPSSPSSPQGVLVWRGGSGNQLAHPGAGVGRLSGKCLSPSERRPVAAVVVQGNAAQLQLITATHRRTSRISDLARPKGIVHLKKNLISCFFLTLTVV